MKHVTQFVTQTKELILVTCFCCQWWRWTSSTPPTTKFWKNIGESPKLKFRFDLISIWFWFHYNVQKCIIDFLKYTLITTAITRFFYLHLRSGKQSGKSIRIQFWLIFRVYFSFFFKKNYLRKCKRKINQNRVKFRF